MLSHSQKLEAIREHVIAAVPEIVELKFGCVLKDACGYGYTVWRVFPRNPNGTQGVKTDVDQIEDISGYKIIGRPIALADVLLTIDKKTGDISIGSDGRFILNQKHWAKWGNGKFAVTWNLLKPLKEQEESTISFIHSLLCE